MKLKFYSRTLQKKITNMSLRQALRESKEAAKREAAEAERARLGIVDAPAPPRRRGRLRRAAGLLFGAVPR